MVVDLLNMTEEKAKGVALHIAQMTYGSATFKAKDRFCYRFFNMRYNESDFNYLTQIEGKALPAKMKFIPIIRPKIQYLISQVTMMDIMYKVRLVDRESLNKRAIEKFKNFTTLLNAHLDEEIGNQEFQTQLNNEVVQQLMQQAQQDPKAKMMAMASASKMQTTNKLIKESISRLEKKHEQLQITDTYSPSEYIEYLAHRLLKWLIEKDDLKAESVSAFTDKSVSGKELFHVHFNETSAHPFLRRIHPLDCYWSADENTRWIQHCRWASIRHRYTAIQIVEAFKPYLTDEFLEQLKTQIGSTTGTTAFLPNYDTGATDKSSTESPELSDYPMYTGTYTGVGYDVIFTYFKAIRKIVTKKIPNPYQPGKYFRHFSDKQKDIEDWDNDVKKWNEKNPKAPAKAELIIREVCDLWEAATVFGKQVIYARKCPVQLRDENYNVELPIIGPSFNHIGEQPYSLVWATKDIQELYNIITWHQELMLAVSGTKGNVMDDTQRPAGMSRSEWIYYKKRGSLLIEPGQTKPGRRPSTFNQWTSYDETVSPAIQYLEKMKLALEDTASMVTGISRQSTARIVNSDQVGTSQLATRQTQIVTEILFWEHDQVFRKGLTRLLNLCRLVEDEGPYSIFNEDGEEEIFYVPKNIFKGVQFDLYLSSSSGEHRDMIELKQTMLAAWQRGQLALDEAVSLYAMKNFTQLEKAAKYFAQRRNEIAALSAQNTEQAKSQAKQEEIKLGKEYDAMMKRETNQIAQYKAKIDEAKLQIEKLKLALEEKKLGIEATLKNKEIDSEREVELAYLSEQASSNQVAHELDAISLQLDALQGTIDTASKERIENKKAEVAKQKNVEKIKD